MIFRAKLYIHDRRVSIEACTILWEFEIKFCEQEIAINSLEQSRESTNLRPISGQQRVCTCGLSRSQFLTADVRRVFWAGSMRLRRKIFAVISDRAGNE